MNSDSRSPSDALPEPTTMTIDRGACPNCAAAITTPNIGSVGPSGFIYAIGRIAPQFPDLGIEKEFAQLGAGLAAERGMLETNRLVDILEDPANSYLARQLCWVFNANETEAFVLMPRDDAQVHALVESLPRAEQALDTVQVIVGAIGALPAGSACLGVNLPSVSIDQHLTFPMHAFIDGISVAQNDNLGDQDSQSADSGDHREQVHEHRSSPEPVNDVFHNAARDLFARLTQRSNNHGIADEHRAANYIALRYPQVYQLAADAWRDQKGLVDVQLRRAPSGTRTSIAVRLIFRAHRTDVIERYSCLVDVTDRFPFLAAPLSRVYD